MGKGAKRPVAGTTAGCCCKGPRQMVDEMDCAYDSACRSGESCALLVFILGADGT